MTQPALRDTRDSILDAAEAIAMESGVTALTFDEIARVARVSKGGVLYHFASKDALIAAMIERFNARFDEIWVGTIEGDPEARGRSTRAYVRASLGRGPGLGEGWDHACGSIQAALANFPERLEPVREQSARFQDAVERDGIDPILATIVRLAVDGLWIAENFNLARFDPALKAAVTERLVAWTELRDLPSPDESGAPRVRETTEPERGTARWPARAAKAND